jgi:hypothetical protein
MKEEHSCFGVAGNEEAWGGQGQERRSITSFTGETKVHLYVIRKMSIIAS